MISDRTFDRRVDLIHTAVDHQFAVNSFDVVARANPARGLRAVWNVLARAVKTVNDNECAPFFLDFFQVQAKRAVYLKHNLGQPIARHDYCECEGRCGVGG